MEASILSSASPQMLRLMGAEGIVEALCNRLNS